MNKYKRITAAALVMVLSIFICSCGSSNNAVKKDGALNSAGESVMQVSIAGASNTGYADVAEKAWYAQYVDYVTESGLMNGTGNGLFSPDDIFTRAQLSAVLYRINGEPAVFGEDSFADTESGSWYSDAVLWAEQNNVVNGVGEGRFAPDDPVTQEQIVTMFWRMEGEPEASSFADASPYAAAAAGWAAEKGITPETRSYTFNPREKASRAQVAALLTEYLNLKDTKGENMSESDKDTLLTAGSEVRISSLEHNTDNLNAPVVYFTPDITSEGLISVFNNLGWNPSGKTAVKVSTGEPPASNYLRPELISGLVKKLNGTIVECNTAYGGSRARSAMHRQVAEDHGFTSFADFDLMDEDGEISWPVQNGTRIDRAIVGSHADNYTDWLILSHFKGHAMAGFGGAIKNVAIGMSSPTGKVYVHSAGTRTSGSIMHDDQDAWLEALPEMVTGVRDHVGAGHIVYINVMNRLSVDCDCDGNPAEPDMHDIGILASTDPVALDQACVDLVYSVPDGGKLISRMESRHGIRVLEHGEEIGLGSREYRMVNIND